MSSSQETDQVYLQIPESPPYQCIFVD